MINTKRTEKIEITIVDVFILFVLLINCSANLQHILSFTNFSFKIIKKLAIKNPDTINNGVRQSINLVTLF